MHATLHATLVLQLLQRRMTGAPFDCEVFQRKRTLSQESIHAKQLSISHCEKHCHKDKPQARAHNAIFRWHVACCCIQS